MKANHWLNHLLSLTVAGVFVLPLLWMLSASLRPAGLPPPRGLEWISMQLTLSNYFHIFEILPFGRYIINSLYISMVGILFTLLTASWAGLAMSLLGKRGRLHLLILSVVLQIIPITAVWLTRFLLFAWIGITNSRWSLLAPR